MGQTHQKVGADVAVGLVAAVLAGFEVAAVSTGGGGRLDRIDQVTGFYATQARGKTLVNYDRSKIGCGRRCRTFLENLMRVF